MFGVVAKPRTGRFGVEFIAGTRDISLLRNVQNVPGAYAAFYSIGTGFILLLKGRRSIKLTTTLHVAQKRKE